VDSSPPRHGSVVHSRDARLWIQPVIPVEERGVAVEDAPERGVCERNVPVAPCGVGVSGHRTSPTHSPRGMRDQPETTIRTTTERLAGRRWRRPGDGACGIATSRPDRPGASPVPVTGVTKDHGLVRERRLTSKGPCRSYRRGPFFYFRSGSWCDWSRPLVNSTGAKLWTSRSSLWTTGLGLWTGLRKWVFVEIRCPKPLVVVGSQAVELLPRSPSGDRGIGRRRRSAPPPNGLPGGGGGGRMTGPPGSWEPAGSTGSVIGTGRSGGPPDPGLVSRPDGHQLKGPCRSYRQGPFNFLPVRLG
jgi:hypothetical protein